LGKAVEFTKRVEAHQHADISWVLAVAEPLHRI
jgi:hypothetical protein